ncbi:hypothetical protein MNB_SUP05-5-1104 [hydrothermal vent metagenome]|uniref:DUF3144 domain-containing protein n=1 Tax=hydrothermal vent metagenome TaxID=652676 RepID=A0A1W1BZ47_9ZZZZ
MSDTKDNTKEKNNVDKITIDKKFIKIADTFITNANQLCEVEKPDHQLVNAALLYASARFSAFITASLAGSKDNYQKNSDEAIKFYVDEFTKMLKEHIKQYEVVFDKKPDIKKK